MTTWVGGFGNKKGGDRWSALALAGQCLLLVGACASNNPNGLTPGQNPSTVGGSGGNGTTPMNTGGAGMSAAGTMGGRAGSSSTGNAEIHSVANRERVRTHRATMPTA